MVHSEPPPRVWPLPQPLQGQVSWRQPRPLWPLGSRKMRQNPAQVVVPAAPGPGTPTAARRQSGSPVQEALGLPAWGSPFTELSLLIAKVGQIHGCSICRVHSASTAQAPERVSVRSVVTLGPGWGVRAAGPRGCGARAMALGSQPSLPQHQGCRNSWSLCSGTTGPT